MTDRPAWPWEWSWQLAASKKKQAVANIANELPTIQNPLPTSTTSWHYQVAIK
jgi:hypothetical protein